MSLATTTVADDPFSGLFSPDVTNVSWSPLLGPYRASTVVLISRGDADRFPEPYDAARAGVSVPADWAAFTAAGVVVVVVVGAADVVVADGSVPDDDAGVVVLVDAPGAGAAFEAACLLEHGSGAVLELLLELVLELLLVLLDDESTGRSMVATSTHRTA
jgi:hypothetical protein